MNINQYSHHNESLVGTRLNSMLFKFEEEFMPNSIRCIPMVVRFKLDLVGIKLNLKHWNKFSDGERRQLMEIRTDAFDDKFYYKEFATQLILQHAKQTTNLIVEDSPPWSNTNKIPEQLIEKSADFGWRISLDKWSVLDDLQRFALIKLSRPSHENKNFPKAMIEFGLAQ